MINKCKIVCISDNTMKWFPLHWMAFIYCFFKYPFGIGNIKKDKSIKA